MCSNCVPSFPWCVSKFRKRIRMPCLTRLINPSPPWKIPYNEKTWDVKPTSLNWWFGFRFTIQDVYISWHLKSGMLSDILSGTLSGILSGLTYIRPIMLSDMLSDINIINSDGLSDILSDIQAPGDPNLTSKIQVQIWSDVISDISSHIPGLVNVYSLRHRKWP